MKTLDHPTAGPRNWFRLARNILAIVFLCVAVSTNAATNELTTFLQKGLLEEEANQDLAAAARSYELAVRHFDQDRKLAATALFRLAEVYRKQGRASEAEVYYQRVVREFSDQKTLADLSRERLPTSSPVNKVVVESNTATDRETKVTGITFNSYDAQLEGNWIRTSFASQFGDYVYSMARHNTGDLSTATFVPELPESGNYHVEIWYVEAENRATNAAWVIRGAEASSTNFVNQRINGREWFRIASNMPFKKGKSGSVQLSNKVKEVVPASVVVADRVRFVPVRQDIPARKVNTIEPAQDEQAADIRRLQTIIRNSPDLLNALETPIEDKEMGGYLHQAAGKGQEKVVEYLLENGADINLASNDKSITNPKRYTPLHVATDKGQQHVVKLLISKGADVKAQMRDGETALHIAAQNGFKMIAAELLAAGADVNSRTFQGRTPLHFAALSGHKTLAEFLIEKGADVNARLLNGGTPLIAAVSGNSYETARILISKGADVNALAERDETALLYAVKDGKEKLAELLLQNGADVQIKFLGSPILTYAIAMDRGNGRIVPLLLKHGANPNRGKDQPPLFQAIDKRNSAILDALLSAKADITVTNSDGATPLHAAAQAGSVPMIESLLKAGASIDHPDASGKTPLMYAIQFGKSLPAIEALLKKGANPNKMDQLGQTTIGIVQNFLHPHPNVSRIITGAEPNWNEVLSLLKQHGGDELLQRKQEIRATRAGLAYPLSIFNRSTMHESNRFTLFEGLAQLFFLAQQPRWEFPDFEHITIHRVTGNKVEKIELNLKEALLQGDCSKDMPLEWGDIIELPKLDVKLGQPWSGLPGEVQETFRRCLSRKVTLRIANDNVTILALPTAPGPGGFQPMPIGSVSEGTITARAWLSAAVYSGPLRTSSDLSRVRVTRVAPSSGDKQTYTFDLRRDRKPSPDLWLREGDLIEVPEIGSTSSNAEPADRSKNNEANATPAAAAGSTELCNGRDLTGWNGDPEVWSVKDGMIRGEMKDQRKAGMALIWDGGEVKDFELTAFFRFDPRSESRLASAAVCYRARKPSPNEVRGYQYRVTKDGNNTGMLSARDRTGMISYTQKTVAQQIDGMDRVEGVLDLEPLPVILAAFKKQDWNKIEIVARGNHFVHKINGKVVADLTDNNKSRVAASGLLALELLSDIKPYIVEFKDIRLQRLSNE